MDSTLPLIAVMTVVAALAVVSIVQVFVALVRPRRPPNVHAVRRTYPSDIFDRASLERLERLQSGPAPEHRVSWWARRGRTG